LQRHAEWPGKTSACEGLGYENALTSLNVDIWNTLTHHEACMMVAGQLFGRAPMGDEKMREPARAECRAYRSPYQDASRMYRRLR
jgi:hypothetical protein